MDGVSGAQLPVTVARGIMATPRSSLAGNITINQLENSMRPRRARLRPAGRALSKVAPLLLLSLLLLSVLVLA